jgi:hypothetical protein
MRVISLINGSLISETMTVYALHYAKQLNASVDLVYIKGRDSLKDIMLNVENLRLIAQSLEVEIEYSTFDSLLQLKEFVEDKDVDMLFCSTRQKHTIFDRSFVKSLIAQNIKVDLAVLKVVKLGNASTIENIIMPIRDTKLSVKKFTLFSTFSLAYNAKSEIYSLDEISSKDMYKVTPKIIKSRLKDILFGLRHYLKLLRALGVTFAIKHDFALTEGERVKSHIAKHHYDLAIVGAHHEKALFSHHPIDILFENPMINTIYFLPHKD